MRKIYDLNINDFKQINTFNTNIKKEFNNKYKKVFSELRKLQNTNDIIIKLDNKFYKIKIIKDKRELGGFCDYCDFKSKCWDVLEYCMLDYIFLKETDYVLKKIEEYEIIFGEDNYENN